VTLLEHCAHRHRGGGSGLSVRLLDAAVEHEGCACSQLKMAIGPVGVQLGRHCNSAAGTPPSDAKLTPPQARTVTRHVISTC
jgi:hypothetical protein